MTNSHEDTMKPLRPLHTDLAILHDALQSHIELLLDWVKNSQCAVGQDCRITADCLYSALNVQGDAFTSAQYLFTEFKWPSDTRLVRHYDSVYRYACAALPSHIRKWVMANAIRFPAKKGNSVKVMVGGVEYSGVITDVLPSEARGWVELLNVKDKGKIVSVNAEDVIKVTSTGNGLSPNTPNTPPDGGTPVAARTHGEKLIEKLRAA